MPLQVVFWGYVAWEAVGTNIGSVQLELADLRVRPAEISRLEERGFTRPRQLLRARDDEAGLASIRAALGDDDARTRRVLERAELYAFKGIGAPFGRVLESLGIKRVDQLATEDPEALHARVARAAGASPFVPRLDMVRVWVLASRDRGIFLSHSTSAPEP